MTFFGPDLRNGVPVGLGSVAGMGRRGYTPAQLFAQGQAGVWYDPSDLGTLFQDSAGTTPVTGVEQAVGLVLDKSRGVAVGADVLLSWATAGFWSLYNIGPVVFSGGTAAFDAENDRVAAPTAFTAGKTYRVTIAVTVTGAGALRLDDDGAGGGMGVNTTYRDNITAPTTFYFTATASTRMRLIQSSASGSVTVTSLSVREIAGTHAIQASNPSRPVLRNRYNLLTYSEQFDNAAWTKSFAGTGISPIVTANAGIAPDGTLTADRIQFDCTDTSTSANRSYVAQAVTTIPSGHSVSGEIWLRAFDAGAVGQTVRVAFEGFGNPIVHTLSLTWTKITGSGAGSGTANLLFETRGQNTGRTADVLVWGADVRRTIDTLYPYQQITTATSYDADTSKFPLYLAFDGSDDSLYTAANLDLSGTDKVTVFAGVTKLSDAVRGVAVELSDTTSNAGTFSIEAPSVDAQPRLQFFATGSNAVSAGVNNAIYAAPYSAVVTGVGNISGDSCVLRLNGAQVATSTADQGTGNFGSYPLYIGRRNNASLPYNGRLHQLIVRGAQSSTAEIASTERYIAGKQGRSL